MDHARFVLTMGLEAGERTAQAEAQTLDQVAARTHMGIGQVGKWSAIASAICSVGYGLAVIALMVDTLTAGAADQAAGWSGVEDFLATFRPILMLPLFPSLLLVPAFTALMVSIHSMASKEKQIWSCLGLAFTLIYASLAAWNYLVQLLPVWQSIRAGAAEGLAMFAMGNPGSIFWGLVYCYGFMNLGMLFSGLAFGGNRLENRVRLLFLLNGASLLVTLGSALTSSSQFYLLGSLVVWCPLFTAAVIFTAVFFQRMVREAKKNLISNS